MKVTQLRQLKDKCKVILDTETVAPKLNCLETLGPLFLIIDKSYDIFYIITIKSTINSNVKNSFSERILLIFSVLSVYMRPLKKELRCLLVAFIIEIPILITPKNDTPISQPHCHPFHIFPSLPNPAPFVTPQ